MDGAKTQAALKLPTPSELASELAARRKSNRGASLVVRPCKKCGVELGARELRKHKCAKELG